MDKGHFSKLTLVLDQGYDATTLRYTWEDVPVGQEDVTRRNFGEYYIKSIKTTFGYVSRPSSSVFSRLLLFVILPSLICLVAYYLYFGGAYTQFGGDW